MWHMEKQEFRPGYPLWIWAVIAIMLVACTCLFIAHGRYASLLVLTPPLLITGVRLLSVYTITPDSFILAIRGMKPRHVFPLQNITEIEKEGKHLLLVDDVLTTGATVVSCADAFRGIPGLRISVLTLALAGES